MNLKLLVVGTVRNVGKNLEKEIKKFEDTLNNFGSVDFFLVESDSTDETFDVLISLQRKKLNFKFESFGILATDIPNRIERIRYCRNEYVNYIRQTISVCKWNFVVVVDFDRMNNSLSRNGIKSCFSSSIQWDGCFANQKYGYYDIYALRAKNWVEEDCFYTLEKLKQKNPYKEKFSISFLRNLHAIMHFDRLRYLAIFSKMKVLPKNSSWIQVDSAFGAFAIYKSELFLISDYSQKTQTHFSTCEHVDFNLSAIDMGAKLFINPELINSKLNEYNLNRFTIIRFIRELKKFYPFLDEFVQIIFRK